MRVLVDFWVLNGFSGLSNAIKTKKKKVDFFRDLLLRELSLPP